MIDRDREAFADLLQDLCDLFDREIRPGVAAQYWDELKRWHIDVVTAAAAELKRSSTTFPTLAAWIAAAKRARQQRVAVSQPEGQSVELTWDGAAAAVLVQLRLSGVDDALRDDAARDRALGLIRAEFAAGVREEYSRPKDCPPDVWVRERQRIVAAVREQIRAVESHDCRSPA